jgi:threonine dehydratase
LRKYVDGILLVSEEEIRTTMRLVWQRMKIVIEPSSAVALAPLLREGGVAALGLPTGKHGKSPRVGVILSGGNVELG